MTCVLAISAHGHVTDLLCYVFSSTKHFECYCWQNYTIVNKTDLYLSYFHLSYIHNDSVQRGLTVMPSDYLQVLTVDQESALLTTH